jgi:cyclase
VEEVNSEASQHFRVEELASGVYACIHKSGGGAYSNAGIVDLGDQTIVVDAFDTMIAGRALRQTAEALLGRPVDRLVLTHPHSDHWIGASEFDQMTNSHS